MELPIAVPAAILILRQLQQFREIQARAYCVTVAPKSALACAPRIDPVGLSSDRRNGSGRADDYEV